VNRSPDPVSRLDTTSARSRAEFPATSWRVMSRDQLDAGLDNSKAVTDSDTIVAEWQRQSAVMRGRYPDHLDMRYGPRERNRIDFLKAQDGAPTLLFIHGGYWQFRAKEHFAFVAAGALARGINVALLGYSLAPEVTLDAIVAEVHAGVDFLARMLPDRIGGAAPLVAAGWSAGGHLATMAMAHPGVAAALSISGIFDLEPIRHSYLNDKLRLDESASLRNSPIGMDMDRTKPMSLVVGGAELPLLREQTSCFAATRSLRRLPTSYEEIPDANHFTIMDELARPDGRITILLQRLIDDTRR
jgi:arylformamidase